MKYNTQDLLTLLISLFIFSSCSNPSLVGLDIDERDQIQGELIDTLTVKSSLFKLEPAISAGSSITPLGYIKDPVLGESEAGFAFAVAPMFSEDNRLPANITIDSVVLVMNYGSSFFGDSTGTSYQIQVHQLQQPFKFNTPYKTDAKWELSPTLMGEQTVSTFNIKDSILINKHIDGKDTVNRVAPQLRIPLAANQIKTIFDANQDSASFANAEQFHARVKGFYVNVNKATMQGNGGIVEMAINSETNGIEVYYKLPDSTSQSLRTYQISSANSAAAISHAYNEEILQQLETGGKELPVTYVQGLNGLATALQFPYLEDLKERGFIINKALLTVSVEQEKSGTVFNYQAPRLTLYQKDIAGQYMPIPDGDTRTDANGRNISDPRSFGVGFGGFYLSKNKQYEFILTSYIQDILLGKAKNKEIYMTVSAAQNLTSVPYRPDFKIGSRAILGANGNEKYKMELKLYVSKTK